MPKSEDKYDKQNIIVIEINKPLVANTQLLKEGRIQNSTNTLHNARQKDKEGDEKLLDFF